MTARLLASRFARDDGGAIAIVFALMLVPLLGLILTAVDWGRAETRRVTLQNAADAAVFAASQRLLEGSEVARRTFAAAFEANLPPELAGQAYELDIPSDASRIGVRMASEVPTTLVALMGVQQISVSVAATAERPAISILAGLPKGAPKAMPTPEQERMAEDAARALRRLGLSAEGLSGGLATGPGPRIDEARMRELEAQMRRQLEALRYRLP